jgi:type VI secretion system protein ImpE
MKIEEYLRAGKLHEAFAAVQEDVRNRPADPAPRSSLFQVLALLGQWGRALNQLKVLADLDAQTALIARLYEPVLQAELQRQDILEGKTAPLIFGNPESWMASVFHGNSLAAKGEFTAAKEVLQAALDQAPATPGEINGSPFRWLADADPRFGPFLEAVIEGKYFWVPFFRLRELRILPPEHLRDLIWIPAGFVWSHGAEGAGFIFARYPGERTSRDDAFCLARKTAWEPQAEGLSFGCGQRLLASETEDYPVLDIRSIVFKTA